MHPNEQLIRTYFDAFSRGDSEALGQHLADDVVLHIPGRSSVAGEYKGREQAVGYFGRLMELTGGTFGFDPHDVLANDDHIVALVLFRAQRAGKKVEYRGTLVYHVRDGKLSEAWLSPEDQYTFDEFWS